MKYLPILQELFESDGVVIFLMGVALAILLGIMLKKTRYCIMGTVCAAAVYVVCEILMNFLSSYLVEFLFIFIGWIALGVTAGSLFSVLIKQLKKLGRE